MVHWAPACANQTRVCVIFKSLFFLISDPVKCFPLTNVYLLFCSWESPKLYVLAASGQWSQRASFTGIQRKKMIAVNIYITGDLLCQLAEWEGLKQGLIGKDLERGSRNLDIEKTLERYRISIIKET